MSKKIFYFAKQSTFKLNYHKNIPYFIFISIVIFTLKIFFKYSETVELTFLLKPTNEFVKFFTGTQSIFTDSGYYFSTLNILIDKSCSGFNLCLITFVILSYLVLQYYKNHTHKIKALFVVSLISLGIAIFINSARIYTTIAFQERISSMVQISSKTIHEVIGISINITFLIAIYLLAEKILKTKTHAKFFKA